MSERVSASECERECGKRHRSHSLLAVLCRALENASPVARARYQKIGQPLVMGKDIFNGNAGPLWIDVSLGDGSMLVPHLRFLRLASLTFALSFPQAKLEYNVAADKSQVTVNAPCK